MNKDRTRYPTPFQDVNLFLQTLQDSVCAVLGDNFTGMYLFGSLALGDFNPGRSDIDFLVVTSKVLSDNLVSDLRTMHSRLYESELEWAKKLEGAYIPLGSLRVYTSTGTPHPLVHMEKFLVAWPEFHWLVNRQILYQHGIVITGPSLQTIIDPVDPEQLREAVRNILRKNWTPFMYNSDLFSGIGYQPFVVLTMCRALCTLKNGDIASKTLSAEWAITNLDRKWSNLIQQAISWHFGCPPGDVKQTQEFIRYTLKEAGLIEQN